MGKRSWQMCEAPTALNSTSESIVFIVDDIMLMNGGVISEDVVAQTPYRLKDGDVIVMGSTELMVHITDNNAPAGQENVPAN